MSFQDKKRKHLGKNEAPSIGDTAEKLRLIRERQNKWMKERDEARSSETPSSKRSSSNTPGSSVLVKSLSQEALQMELSYSSRLSTGNRDKRNNPRRKPLYPQPKSDRSKVITWTTKGDRKTAKRPPSGHSRSSSVASADVNYLMATKSSSKPSRTYKPTNYSATAKTTQKTYDNSHPDSSRRAHVNNTFDQGSTSPPRKGNPYVEREVQNIYKEHSTKSENEIEEIPSNFKTPGFGSSELPAHLLDALAVTVAEKLRTELSPEKNNKIKASGKTDRDSDMSSHYCNVCKELMTSPRHTPTAAIPCGHTCCKVCIRECQKCPTCGTRILSTAVNTVLESIITDFKAEKERERLQKLEQETRKYVDEYQSLSLRCEALTGLYPSFSLCTLTTYFGV